MNFIINIILWLFFICVLLFAIFTVIMFPPLLIGYVFVYRIIDLTILSKKKRLNI